MRSVREQRRKSSKGSRRRKAKLDHVRLRREFSASSVTWDMLRAFVRTENYPGANYRWIDHPRHFRQNHFLSTRVIASAGADHLLFK
jgi:hypothetical protein